MKMDFADRLDMMDDDCDIEGYSLEESSFIKMEIDAGFIYPDGSPRRCSCGCTDFEDFNEHYCSYGREEYSVRCTKCGQIVGHWAYGQWCIV
jgi:hypothetical protein